MHTTKTEKLTHLKLHILFMRSALIASSPQFIGLLQYLPYWWTDSIDSSSQRYHICKSHFILWILCREKLQTMLYIQGILPPRMPILRVQKILTKPSFLWLYFWGSERQRFSLLLRSHENENFLRKLIPNGYFVQEKMVSEAQTMKSADITTRLTGVWAWIVQS